MTKSAAYIRSPTSVPGETTRLWISFEGEAPETEELPNARRQGSHLVAEWPASQTVDAKAAVKRLHRETRVLFAYEQPAEPPAKRRRPAAARTAAALSTLELPDPQALHAALLADLVAERRGGEPISSGRLALRPVEPGDLFQRRLCPRGTRGV